MHDENEIKEQICEIGRRIYNKGFAAANDGNITFRLSDDRVLCTPTMHNKGFLKAGDICLIDMQGKQLAGNKKRSSEALLHLQIYRERPDVKSVVHCHPPHATAFAIAREPIPQCVLPEVEVFLGEVPITRYETPGGQAFADTIIPVVKRCNIIILANHGTISFGDSVERAYWWTEILDAYCRMLILARGLGKINYFTPQKERELLDLKAQWGFDDPRNQEGMEHCDLCANDVFRDSWAEAGVARRAFDAPPLARGRHADSAQGSVAEAASQPPQEPQRQPPLDQEALIQAIADRVVEMLAQKGS